MLGNHSKVLSLGDTVATQPNHHCGCGALVSECPFWRRINAGSNRDAAAATVPRPELFVSPRLNQAATILTAIAAFRLGKRVSYRSFAKGVDHQLVVCREFRDFDLFIDGFKSVSRYCALKAAGFPVRGVIHLLRDPRSFVASSKRKNVPVKQAAWQWSSMHATISRVTRLMGERVIEIRYEELCASTEPHLLRLQSWMGLDPEPLLHAFPPDRHWVGNRTMLAFDGTVALRESWRERLSEADRAEIERVCGWQASAWGYNLSAS
jgi:hypothetical protein